MNNQKDKQDDVWIQTQSGQFHLLGPRPGEVRLDDIVRALDRIPRFAGHLSVRYTVLQHSLAIARYQWQTTGHRGLVMTALLHDAAEAYIGDITSPMKKLFGGTIKQIEQGIMKAIWYELVPGKWHYLMNDYKEADRLALGAEARLWLPPHEWKDSIPKDREMEYCSCWSMVYGTPEMFRKTYEWLIGGDEDKMPEVEI